MPAQTIPCPVTLTLTAADVADLRDALTRLWDVMERLEAELGAARARRPAEAAPPA
jgi:hypothetical protein